ASVGGLQRADAQSARKCAVQFERAGKHHVANRAATAIEGAATERSRQAQQVQIDQATRSEFAARGRQNVEPGGSDTRHRTRDRECESGELGRQSTLLSRNRAVETWCDSFARIQRGIRAELRTDR